MGLWLNLGFITFIILAVLSGQVRAAEVRYTPFTVCPLDAYRETSSEYEFVTTRDTLYIPYFFQLQIFTHRESVRRAQDFMVALNEKKREILANNQRQIRTLISCLSGTGNECQEPRMSAMVFRYLGNDFKKALTLHRVFQALAFSKSLEDAFSLSAYWDLPSQINYTFENSPGYGLIEARQEPLNAIERQMAEDLYLEWWESFSLDVERYYNAEIARPENDRYRKFLFSKALSELRAARLQIDRTQLVRAIALADLPGWSETMKIRFREFRKKMAETWFQNFNAFRVFAFIGVADPTPAQIQSALESMYLLNETQRSQLARRILEIRGKETTWSSVFSLSEEPKSLIEHTLARAETHCRIASNLYYLSGRSDDQANALLTVMLLGSFWLPQQVVIPLFFSVAGYNSYVSARAFNSERAMFLSFMQEADSVVPGNRVLFTMTDRMLNELLVPLSLFGLPRSVRNIRTFLGT